MEETNHQATIRNPKQAQIARISPQKRGVIPLLSPGPGDMVQHHIPHDEQARDNDVSQQAGPDEDPDDEDLVVHPLTSQEEEGIAPQASAGTVSAQVSTAVRMASSS